MKTKPKLSRQRRWQLEHKRKHLCELCQDRAERKPKRKGGGFYIHCHEHRLSHLRLVKRRIAEVRHRADSAASKKERNVL